MFQFIVTIILMISFGAVLYLVARSLPRVGEEPAAASKGILERWVASGIPEKIDNFINGFLEKFLRKIKIYLLKIDNYLAKHLRRTRQNGNGGAKPEAGIDFKEISGKNNPEEG